MPFGKKRLASVRRTVKNSTTRMRPRTNRLSLVELLEARQVLATYVVDSLLDTVDTGDGVLTLREAVDLANADQEDDLITFDSSLAGGTIELVTISNTDYGNSALTITTEILISASMAPGLVIGRDASATNLRQFFIDTTGVLTIDSVTVAGGSVTGGTGAAGGLNGTASGGASGGGGAGLGGAFYNRGTLTIQYSTLNNNSATGGSSNSVTGTVKGGGGGAGISGDGSRGFGNTGGQGAAGAGDGGTGGSIGVNGSAGESGSFGGGGGGGGGGYSSANGGIGGTGGFGGGGGGGGGADVGTAGTGGTAGFGGGSGETGAIRSRVGQGGQGGGGAGMGGAIFNDLDGVLNIVNSTLSSNSATGGDGYEDGGGLGGAIFSRAGTVNIANATIAANAASSEGGGVYVYADRFQTAWVTVNSSIVAEATSGTEDFVVNADEGDANLYGSGNVITSYSQNVGVIVTADDAPNLDALQDNGGPTETMMLPNDSSAIGIGSNPYGMETDQRGYFYRTVNGFTDAGAVQHNAVAILAPVISSIARTNPASEHTDADELTFTITFDTDVTGVDASQIELTGTAAADCTIIDVDGSGSVYTVTILNNQASGTLGITVLQGVIKDSDDNLYEGEIESNEDYILEVSQTFVVDSLLDVEDEHDGLLTLREAIALAELTVAVDTITFAAELAGGTIELSQISNFDYGKSALTITTEIIIDGSGAPGLVISRSGSQTSLRQFYVTTTGNLTLENLTISGGSVTGGYGASGGGFGSGGGSGGGGAGLGGAIYNRGVLYVYGSTLSNNTATGGFSGIAASTPKAGSGGGGMFGNGSSALFSFPGSGGTGGGGDGGPEGVTGSAATFGGGGGGGGAGTATNGGSGGAGGFGGGGGGGGGSKNPNTAGTGGLGGFGGGDGGSGSALSINVGAGGRGGGGGGLGGAIFNDEGTTTIVNSTLTGNAAIGGAGANNGKGYGGAVFTKEGIFAIYNSTVAYNTANDGGGGIAGIATTDSPPPTFYSTVVSNSSNDDSDVEFFGSGTSAQGTDNFITYAEGDVALSAQTYTGNARLGQLADNGGPTQTIMPTAESPLRGEGSNPLSLAYDQSGRSRDLHGTVDIGAVEFYSPPVVTKIERELPTSELTNATTVVFKLVFDDPVTGVTTSQLQLTGSAAADCSIESIQGSGPTYSVTVSTTSGSGTLGLTVLTGVIANLDGDLYEGQIDSSQTYDINHVAPVANSIVRTTPTDEITSANSVVFTITFDEDVTGVASNQITLTGTAAANASVTQVDGSGKTYTVTVNTTSASGTLGIEIKTGEIEDAYGNLYAGTIVADETYTIDHTPPVVSSIVRTNPTEEKTGANSVVFTLTFDEDVTGVTASQIAPFGTAAADCSITEVSGSGKTYTVTVNTTGANGFLGLEILVGEIKDAYGNLFEGTVETSETYTLDHVAPYISSISRVTPSSEKTNANSVVFAVQFDEFVTGMAANQITLTGTAAGNASVTEVTGDGALYMVTVNTTNANGTLGLSVLTGQIVDTYGNLYAGTVNSAETYDIDHTPALSVLAVGTNSGKKSKPIVNVYDANTGEQLSSILVYGSGYKGGVQIAVGDLTGDGIPEIILTPAANRTIEVKVFTPYGEELTNFSFTMAYQKDRKGASVTVGDVNGDGWNDIITSSSGSQRSLVKIFENNYATTPQQAFASLPIAEFEAFGKKYTSGVSLATGDINGDGIVDIIVGSNKGQVSQIAAFSMLDPQVWAFTQILSITPFGSKFKGGVSVSAGDINGDGHADIIAGAGTKGNSQVQIFNGTTGAAMGNPFTAFPSKTKLPVNVSAKDLNGDGVIDEIFAAVGSSSKNMPVIRYLPNGQPSPKGIDFVLETDPAFDYGLPLG